MSPSFELRHRILQWLLAIANIVVLGLLILKPIGESWPMVMGGICNILLSLTLKKPQMWPILLSFGLFELAWGLIEILM